MTTINVSRFELSSDIFKNNQKIVSVDCNHVAFENNSMGKNAWSSAFYYCQNLRSVTNINENITNMSYAFMGCYDLETFPNIPNGVTDITDTFEFCEKMVNAPVIPNSVTTMDGSFWGCTSLVNAPVIPNSVTDMYGTFGGCTSLVNAPVIPNSVVGSVESLFEGCESLTGDIVIKSEYINDFNCAFIDTSLDKNVYIPFYSSEEKTYQGYYYYAYGEYDDTLPTYDIYSDNVIVSEDEVYSLVYEENNSFHAIGYSDLWMYEQFIEGIKINGENYVFQRNASKDKTITVAPGGSFSTTYSAALYYNYSTENRADDGVQLFDLATYVSPSREISFTFVNNSTNAEFTGYHFNLTLKKDNVTVNTTQIQSGSSVVVGTADTVVISDSGEVANPPTPITSTYSLNGYTNGSTLTIPCQRTGAQDFNPDEEEW